MQRKRKGENIRVWMTVIGRSGGMDQLADLIADEIKVRPDLNVQITQLTTRGRRNSFCGIFVFAFALARFVIAGLRGQIDLLHLNVAAYGSAYRKLILARVARLLNIPYVVHLHAGRFLEFWPSLGPQACQAVDRMFLESEGVVVLGRFWEDFIVSRLASIRSKVSVLPNATKSVVTGPNQRQDVQVHIVYLGILTRLKGIHELISALGQLAKTNNWKATIAGNGQVLESRAQAQALGICDRVSFPGWLDPTEVDDLLRRAHILVLPSYAENLPMTVLEGFAYGLAVIATPVGAVPEVIEDGQNGLIIPVGDAKALADAFRRLIEDPDLRSALGIAARRKHASFYDIKAYVPRLAAVWYQACTPSA